MRVTRSWWRPPSAGSCRTPSCHTDGPCRALSRVVSAPGRSRTPGTRPRLHSSRRAPRDLPERPCRALSRV
eukprot:3705775-Prorocentrum_lima.AAC.1